MVYAAMEYLLPTLRKKQEVDSVIRDTIDKVLVLRFGIASDAVCLQLDDIVCAFIFPSLSTIDWYSRL